MKIKVIFIIIFLVLSEVHAQEYSTKIAEYKKNDIVFRIQFNDILYKIHDTLSVNYKVINNSDSTIYIFDPLGYYYKPYGLNNSDSKSCYFELELGGSWMLLLGYEQIIFVKKIEKYSEYDYEFKFVIKNKSFENSCNNQIFQPYHSDVPIINGVFLNIGYLDNIGTLTSIVNKIEEIKFDEIEFKSDKDGMWFEENLNRFLLGPLWIRHE